jgi:CHAT domain-containing protein/tetratricopeptide (TPR) repeat protein
LLDRGEYVEAEALGRRLTQSLHDSPTPDSIAMAQAFDLSALALRALGRDYAGEPQGLAQRALGILERRLPSDDARIGYAAYVFGQLWGGTNRPEGGRDLLQRALAIQTKALGPDDPMVATTLEAIGWNRSQAADYAAARSFAEQAIELRKRIQGPKSPAIAGGITVLGYALRGSGEPARARAQLSLALAMREKTLGHRNLETATSWMNVGFLETELARYAAADSCYEQALQIREAILGPEDPLVGATLIWTGNSIRDMGNRAGADSVFQRAIRIAERIGQPNGTLVGDALLGIAWIRITERKPEEARAAAERVLQIREARWGPDHPTVAYALERLGDALFMENKFEKCLEIQERALEIRIKALGPRHGDVGRSYRRIGDARSSLGDLADARDAYEKAISIDEEVLGADAVRVATSRFNLGVTLADFGDIAGAREQWERAYQIYKKKMPQSSVVGSALNGVAETWMLEGDFARSHTLLLEALGQIQSASDLDSLDLGQVWRDLAFMLRRQGDVSGADTYLHQAIPLFERSLGENDPQTASTVDELAILRMRQGRLGEALALSDSALAVFLRVHGPDYLHTGESQFVRAAVLQRMGRWRDALAATLEADRIGRSVVRVSMQGVPEERALQIAAQQAVRQSAILGLLAAGGSADSTLNARACDALVHSRALVLDEIAERHRSVGKASAVVRLANTYARAQQRYANLLVRGAKDSDPAEYRTSLERARQDAADAEQALGDASGTFREDKARDGAGLAEVAAALPRGAGLVSYWRYRVDIPTDPPIPPALPDSERYLAITLRGGENPRVYPLGAATEIDSLVARWRAAMWRGVSGAAKGKGGEREVGEAGEALRRRIWDPVADALGGASRIFIVPDAALHLVSFGALPGHDGSYLVEGSATLHLLSAERDLIQAGGNVGSGLFLVGDPAFDASTRVLASVHGSGRSGRTEHASSGSSTTVLASAAPFRSVRSDCSEFRTARFNDLPGTAREVTEISSVWRQVASGDIVSLSAARATETEVKQEAGSGWRVLHFATHGFFLNADCSSAPAGTRGIGGFLSAESKSHAVAHPKGAPASTASVAEKSEPARPPSNSTLLLSGLALAGANHREDARAGDDDGILTAEEIAALDLSGVEWVVLSACETGLGKTLPGEGVFGMRRAFQVAGARTLIMTLWPIEDEAAHQWMRELYTARFTQGLDTAAAVRQATVTLLAARRSRGESTNPFYWGAFVAAGGWR